MLDPVRPAGGPTGPIPGAFLERATDDGAGRIYRIVSTSGSRGADIIVSVELVAKGNETGMSFTLRFDPAKLAFLAVGGTNNNPDVVAGIGSPEGMNRTLNATQAGKGRLGLLLSAATPFEAGTRQIVNLRFRILPNAELGATPLTFDDGSIVRSTTNAVADSLGADYQDGEVSITKRRSNLFGSVPHTSTWSETFFREIALGLRIGS